MAKNKDWDERSTSLGICNYAKTFLDAAIFLHEHDESKQSGPLYYLVCHSIELALKAFLKAKGMPIAESKNRFSHDLEKLLALAIEMGLSLAAGVNVQEINQMIRLANIYYKEKEFEYLYSGAKRYPELNHFISGTKEIIKGAYIACRLDYENSRAARKNGTA